MTPVGVAIALVCLLLAAGYILLGAVQMAAPARVLPVYRRLLGRRLYERNASRFEQMTATNWKMIGAGYVVFGLVLVWSLRGIF